MLLRPGIDDAVMAADDIGIDAFTADQGVVEVIAVSAAIQGLVAERI